MRKRRKTVGIRVPDAAIPLSIVEYLGNPIATTSATLPDGELIPDPWTLNDLFGHAIDLIIDGGYLFPEPTTVIDFTEDLPRLIRAGKGELFDLEYVEMI
jgi:tRNA threonylcarbamoyl adenosine modification protein (Sua5/YciO/YrdC/YwlC family)